MGLYKRGGVWWMRLAVGGRKIRRTTGTADRKLAGRIEAKVKTEIVEGRWFDVQEERTRTVYELLDRYEREHVVKKRGARFYAPIIKRFQNEIGDMTLAEIIPKVLVEYKSKRYAEGVGPATINREIAVLSSAFNLAAREWEWCRSNPCAKIKPEKEPPGRDRYLTREEEKKLLDGCSNWLQDIVVFALNTGMRQGEILSLRWPSVDLFRRTATVERSKNGEKRTIPVNEAVMELLKVKSKVRSISCDLVFPNSVGKVIERGNLERSWRAGKRKAKLDDFRFHDLRHTFATRLVQAGVDVYKVQKLLGHKDPKMTQRYAHHSTESLRAGVEVLDLVRTGAQNVTQSVPEKSVGLG